MKNRTSERLVTSGLVLAFVAGWYALMRLFVYRFYMGFYNDPVWRNEAGFWDPINGRQFIGKPSYIGMHGLFIEDWIFFGILSLVTLILAYWTIRLAIGIYRTIRGISRNLVRT